MVYLHAKVSGKICKDSLARLLKSPKDLSLKMIQQPELLLGIKQGDWSALEAKALREIPLIKEYQTPCF